MTMHVYYVFPRLFSCQYKTAFKNLQKTTVVERSRRLITHLLLFIAYFVVNILFLGADEAANQVGCE